MSQYFIKEISENEAIHYKERYFDSTRFYELEYEFDPVRVLKTAFRGQNKKFYELTIMISTLEQDDIMVDRDLVRHATYLYTDCFRGCFQEKLDPFL